MEFATAVIYLELDEAVVGGFEFLDDEDEDDLMDTVGDGFFCELVAV